MIAGKGIALCHFSITIADPDMNLMNFSNFLSARDSFVIFHQTDDVQAVAIERLITNAQDFFLEWL